MIKYLPPGQIPQGTVTRASVTKLSSHLRRLFTSHSCFCACQRWGQMYLFQYLFKMCIYIFQTVIILKEASFTVKEL